MTPKSLLAGVDNAIILHLKLPYWLHALLHRLPDDPALQWVLRILGSVLAPLAFRTRRLQTVLSVSKGATGHRKNENV